MESAAENVAGVFGAEKFAVEEVTETAQGGKQNIIVLSLENLANTKKDYPKNYITSVSALGFIQNLTESDYTEFDAIKIKVKTNSESFENQYRISEILTAQKLIKTVDLFFLKIKNSDLDSLNLFFDPNNVSDSNMVGIKNTLSQVDSLEGKVVNLTLVGFDFKTTGKEKTPVLITHTNAAYQNSYVDFTLVLRVSDKKIIHFGMNEKAVGY